MAVVKLLIEQGAPLMKIQALLTSLLLSATFAQANQSLRDERITEMMLPSYIKEYVQAVNFAQLSKDVGYKLSGTEVADECVAIMNQQQVLGEVGAFISQAFIENASRLPLLVEGKSMNRYCKNYSKMSEKEKSIVWVLVMTTVAHFESSCKPKASAQGPNGTAYGYYQLHKGQEQNYDDRKGFCKKGDAGKPKDASRCVLGMLEKQFDRQNGELFSKASYWDVLRPNGSSQKSRIIRKALERSSFCNPTSI
jgi:hypothetical protein